MLRGQECNRRSCIAPSTHSVVDFAVYNTLELKAVTEREMSAPFCTTVGYVTHRLAFFMESIKLAWRSILSIYCSAVYVSFRVFNVSYRQ